MTDFMMGNGGLNGATVVIGCVLLVGLLAIPSTDPLRFLRAIGRSFMDMSEAFARVLEWPGRALRDHTRTINDAAAIMAQIEGSRAEYSDPFAGKPAIDGWLYELRQGFIKYPWSSVFFEAQVARHMALWDTPPTTAEEAIDGRWIARCEQCSGPAVHSFNPSDSYHGYRIACADCALAALKRHGLHHGGRSFELVGRCCQDMGTGMSRGCLGSGCGHAHAREEGARLAALDARRDKEQRDKLAAGMVKVG